MTDLGGDARRKMLARLVMDSGRAEVF